MGRFRRDPLAPAGPSSISVCQVAVHRNAVQVEAAVVFDGPENPLHVVLRLLERDVVDEFVLLESRAFGLQRTTRWGPAL